MLINSRRIVAVAFLAVVVAACGDDGGATTTTTPSDGTTVPPAAETTTTQATPTDAGAWCSAVIEFDAFAATLPDPETDEEFFAMVAEILPRFRVLVSGAPSQIRAEMDLILEDLELLASGDDSQVFDPDVADAYDRFDDFVFDVCNYEMES